MELYDMMLNIKMIDTESVIKKVIKEVKEELKGLDTERTCKIYSNYIYRKLKKNHVTCKIINTLELDLIYEHLFVLAYKDENEYYLIDLTYSQFENDDPLFQELLENGYQLVNDETFINYLSNVNGFDTCDITLKDSFRM